MEAPWKWDWMTSGEIADFWNDLMRKKSDQVLTNFDANTTVGFGIYWGTYMANDVAEMFLIDPFRLGRGLGNASTEQVWWKAGLDVLGDVGRATAFLPLGKITKAVPKGGTVSSVASAATSNGVQTATLATSKVPLAVSRSENVVADAYRKLFYFADPAPREGICAFVGLVNAMKHTGRIFINLEDLAKIVKVTPIGAFYKDLAKKAPCSMNDVVHWLQKLNVEAMPHPHLKTIDDVLKAAANDKTGGVYVIAVKWLNWDSHALGELGHLMYVGKTSSGEVRIFDRSGYAVKSLGELEAKVKYPAIRHAYSFNSNCFPIFIPNAKLIEKTANGVKIAGATFGAGFGIAILIRVFTFMTKD